MVSCCRAKPSPIAFHLPLMKYVPVDACVYICVFVAGMSTSPTRLDLHLISLIVPRNLGSEGFGGAAAPPSALFTSSASVLSVSVVSSSPPLWAERGEPSSGGPVHNGVEPIGVESTCPPESIDPPSHEPRAPSLPCCCWRWAARGPGGGASGIIIATLCSVVDRGGDPHGSVVGTVAGVLR